MSLYFLITIPTLKVTTIFGVTTANTETVSICWITIPLYCQTQMRERYGLLLECFNKYTKQLCLAELQKLSNDFLSKTLKSTQKAIKVLNKCQNHFKAVSKRLYKTPKSQKISNNIKQCQIPQPQTILKILKIHEKT